MLNVQWHYGLHPVLLFGFVCIICLSFLKPIHYRTCLATSESLSALGMLCTQSHYWWEQILQDVICFCSPLTYLYEFLGLPQSVRTTPACSINISSLCISVYVQYVQLLCATVCRAISVYLTAELVLPLLLTKDFLSVILARAELDMLQSVWEWVWALGRGALTRQNNNICAKWNAA